MTSQTDHRFETRDEQTCGNCGETNTVTVTGDKAAGVYLWTCPGCGKGQEAV